MATRLIIVDDHRIVRSGMRSLLEEEDDIEVVGEADDGESLLQLLEEVPTDVVLMDVNLKEMSGIRTTERLSEEHPGIRVLGLTMHEEGDTIERMLDAGAKGYIFKDVDEEELQEGIRAVAKGERFFSTAASRKLIEHLQEKGKGLEKAGHPELTDQEMRVLDLIAREYTNCEIADELEISPKTVDGHRRRLFQKLNVRNSAGLIRVAMEEGYISSSQQ